MKIKKEDDGLYIYPTKHTYIRLSTDWKQLFGKWNWYSLTFINFTIEVDKWTGGFEVWASLLGFNFLFRWNYDPSMLNKMMKEHEEENPLD